MKRLFAIMALGSALAAFGQARQPVIRMSPFVGSGIGSSEAAMLERLVSSYIVELKDFRVIDSEGQDMALSETETALGLGVSASSSTLLVADFIVTGSIGKIGDVFVFTLENTRVSSGEKLSVSDTAHSISDIVLRARGLTRSLFGRQETTSTIAVVPAAPAADDVPPTADVTAAPIVFKAPSFSNLVGTWRGDKGLETVRLFPNGTGLAVLSGGGALKLRITIDGDRIEIAQDQPNDAMMYKASTITLEMARRIAEQARPMRWFFSLSADGQTLSGSKESIAISGNGASLEVDNNYVREASWTRISR